MNPPPVAAPAGVPCSLCGRLIDPRSATLSVATGLPTCPMCVGAEGLYTQQGRAVKGLAWGSVGAGAGACFGAVVCCIPFAGIALGVAAIVSGARGITLLNRPDYVNRPDRGMLLGAAITGIVLGSLAGIYQVLALTVFAAGALTR